MSIQVGHVQHRVPAPGPGRPARPPAPAHPDPHLVARRDRRGTAWLLVLFVVGLWVAGGGLTAFGLPRPTASPRWAG